MLSKEKNGGQAANALHQPASKYRVNLMTDLVNPDLMHKENFICEKLRRMGYTRERRIRLYGEEFRLISNPKPDGDGFAVDGIARGSADQRRIRVPLSLVVTIRQEFANLENKIHEDKLAA